ncbi:hypothetical protein L209DRAFT_746889 [Thermothelomyces heterothallicus CBS 203.75]
MAAAQLKIGTKDSDGLVRGAAKNVERAEAPAWLWKVWEPTALCRWQISKRWNNGN